MHLQINLHNRVCTHIVGSIILPNLSLLKDRAIIDKLVREEQIDKVITIAVNDVADKDMSGWLRIWLATPFPKVDLTDVIPSAGEGMTKNIRFRDRPLGCKNPEAGVDRHNASS